MSVNSILTLSLVSRCFSSFLHHTKCHVTGFVVIGSRQSGRHVRLRSRKCFRITSGWQHLAEMYLIEAVWFVPEGRKNVLLFALLLFLTSQHSLGQQDDFSFPFPIFTLMTTDSFYPRWKHGSVDECPSCRSIALHQRETSCYLWESFPGSLVHRMNCSQFYQPQNGQNLCSRHVKIEKCWFLQFP